RLGVAQHQGFDCLGGRPVLEEHLVHRGCNRHLDTCTLCERICCAGGRDTFGDHGHLTQHLVERAALPDLHPDVPIAAEPARARQNEVAHACQTAECERVRAELHGQARDLCKAACDQRRQCIVAEAEPCDHPGSHCNDILECAAELDTNHVLAGVRPEVRRLEELLR